MNETLKRYFISSVITFLSGFLLVLYMQIDNITMESLTDGTVIGIMFTAARVGLKGVIEVFLIHRGVLK